MLFIDSSHVIYWLNSCCLLTQVLLSIYSSGVVYWLKSCFLLPEVILFDSNHFIYWLKSCCLLTQVVLFVDSTRVVYRLNSCCLSTQVLLFIDSSHVIDQLKSCCLLTQVMYSNLALIVSFSCSVSLGRIGIFYETGTLSWLSLGRFELCNNPSTNARVLLMYNCFNRGGLGKGVCQAVWYQSVDRDGGWLLSLTFCCFQLLLLSSFRLLSLALYCCQLLSPRCFCCRLCLGCLLSPVCFHCFGWFFCAFYRLRRYNRWHHTNK